jgi:probable rRNA maturation factor
VICPAVAARNATEHEVSLEDELALLVVHGLLHLLGMDHDHDEEDEVLGVETDHGRHGPGTSVR